MVKKTITVIAQTAVQKPWPSTSSHGVSIGRLIQTEWLISDGAYNSEPKTKSASKPAKAVLMKIGFAFSGF